MIYTGAVYRAFKEDRGAGMKTGLFMEHMGCCVDAHNQVCVAESGVRGEVCVFAWMLVYKFCTIVICMRKFLIHKTAELCSC